ncbi:MAG: spermidine synthase, partial [Deltaproteobacteria bacterium]|nr:spermidine synthase [Deltaproteobacteria bacterium]
MFASGAAALIYEVVWAKLLSLAFGSTALSLAIVTSIFFVGMAIGSRVAATLADRLRGPLRVYAGCELAVGALAPATLFLLEAAPRCYRWLGGDPGLGSLLAL